MGLFEIRIFILSRHGKKHGLPPNRATKQMCTIKLPPNPKRGIKTIFNHFRNMHAREKDSVTLFRKRK